MSTNKVEGYLDNKTNPAGFQVDGEITVKVNNVSIKHVTSGGCQAGALVNMNTNQPDSIHAEAIFVCKANCGGLDWDLRLRIYDVSNNLLAIKTATVTTAGTYKLHVDYNYTHTGDQDGAPMYLETLDKLDQRTSALYDPLVRKRGNLLNL